MERVKKSRVLGESVNEIRRFNDSQEPEPDREMKFKRIGGGRTHWKNRIIKPGEVFIAIPEEIPVNFRDVLVPLEPEKLEEKKKIHPVETKYYPRHTGSGWYEIIDSNGKVISENKMRKDKANKFIQDLSI